MIDPDWDGQASVREAEGVASVSTHVVELTHRDVRERLSEYLEGSLAADERRRVRAHLDVCTACRAYFGTLRKTIDIAGSLTRPPAPARAKQRVLDALRAHPGPDG